MSTSCPLKPQVKAVWGNHLLRPQLPLEEKGIYSQAEASSAWYLSADLFECIYNAQLFDGLE